MKAFLLAVAVSVALLTSASEKKTVLYANGRVQYEYETEGQFFNGRFAAYFENGKLQIRGQFTNNQKTGTWRVWDENNILRSERLYTNNNNFTIVSEWNAEGVKTRSQATPPAQHSECDQKDYLFLQRYVSYLSREEQENEFVFGDNGIVKKIIDQLNLGSLSAFSESNFVTIVNKFRYSCTEFSHITGIKIKEEYFYCSVDQSMKNKITGVCLMVKEGNVEKELAWIYMPDLQLDTLLAKQLTDHQFASTIIKTTVDDPSFKLRDVPTSENDQLRLSIIHSEATAILYGLEHE